jgi:ketosteroid isomerase-like protein
MNEGDVQRAIDHFDEDVVVVIPDDSYLLAGTFKGRRSVVRFFMDWFASFEPGHRFDVVDATSVDTSQVVSEARFTARGRSSGVAVERPIVWLYRFRQGRIVRAEVFPTRAAALAAAAGSEVGAVSRNVEAVRSFLRLAGRAPDEVWDFFDDEVVWEVGLLGMPDFPETSSGPGSVRDFFRRWVSAFEDWSYEIEDTLEGPDSVAVLVHQWGRGKGSGALVDQRFWQVYVLRDSKAVRVTHHLERSDALAAAGLSGA